MSTEDELRILFLCEQKLLFPINPQIGERPNSRCLFVSSLVWKALNPPYESEKDGIRMGRTLAMLDNFVEGRRISVRLPPSKKVDAYIALLDKADEEIWEIRVRDPRPGVRIFGRFACLNVFIGLLPVYREDLTDSKAIKPKEAEDKLWNQAKLRCRSEWEKLFPLVAPHTGKIPHDYISNNIFIV